MLPVELPASGLAKLNGIAPSALPAAPGACGEFATPEKAGASVELGGIVTLGIAATWAKHVPHPSETIATAVSNKSRIFASCAISD
jgi:hypothetical protein